MKSTKSLARQLGIIKKHPRYVAGGNAGPSITPQVFSYLVVIDFEATCWKGGEGPAGAQSEVIEFPAVLLNTATGEIEAEFHRYVQPQEHPYLSDFCTELTGITQDQVDNGIPLHICLSQFSRWLAGVQTQKSAHFVSGKAAAPGKTTGTANKWGTFVTWSDWDLGVCLLYECRRKGTSKPGALNCWLDLRATYKKFYGRKPNGLKGALRDLGIEFEGREHSGIEDARNTAKLAWRMMCDGCVMQITKSLSGPVPQLKVSNQNHNIKSPQVIQSPKTTANLVGVDSSRHQQTNVKSTVTCAPPSNLPQNGSCNMVKPSHLMNKSNQINKSTHTSQSNQTTAKSVDVDPSNHKQANLKSTATPPSHLQDKVNCNNFVTAASLTDLSQPSRQPLATSTPVSPETYAQMAKQTMSTFTASVKNNSPKASLSGSENTPLQSSISSVKKACVMGSKYTAKSTAKSSAPRGKVYAQPLSSARHGAQNCASSTTNKQRQASNSTTKSTTVFSNLGKVGVKFGTTSGNNVLQAVTNDMADKTNHSKDLTTLGPCPSHTVGQSKMLTPELQSRPSDEGAETCTRPGEATMNKPKGHVFEVERFGTRGSLGKSNMFAASTFITPKQVDREWHRQSGRPRSSISKTQSVTSTGRNPLVIRTSRITPPFCTCGRRAKRKSVINPGPNHGRQFWVCGTGRRDSAQSCNFFKWEITGMCSAHTRLSSARCKKVFSHIEPPLPRMDLDDA